MSEASSPQLYLVTPPDFDPAAFALKLEDALNGGPVACVQIWLAEPSQTTLRAAVAALKPVTDAHDVALTLNGDAALAVELGCDGVHFDDPAPEDVKSARERLGEDGIVGVSCGASRHLAMIMAEAGCDYVSFGPVHDSATKGLDAAPDAMDALAWWAEVMEVPCVAVGGIAPDNLSQVLGTNCEFVCVVSSVWNDPDGPGAAVGRFTKILQSHQIV